jgi:subtilisin family serine protease
MIQGRGGRGSVIIFAAGNYAPVMDYPANSNNNILTVGSINSNGYRSSSSGYGTQLDVVAPGNNILST